MRRLAMLPLVTVLPLLAGCGDDFPEAGDPAVVEVDEAGSDPKVSFAIDVEVGHRERTVLTTDQSLNAAGQSVDGPPIQITQLSEVTSVQGDEIEVTQTFEDIKVLPGGDDAARSAIESTFEDIQGLSGTVTYETTGQIVDSEFDLPPSVDPTFAQTFDQLIEQSGAIGAVYPDDEVGTGSSWTSKSTIELNGIEVEQTATYTLESLEGEDYEISVEIEQDFQEGDVAGGKINGGTGTTTGTITGTIGTLLPASGQLSGTSEVEAEAGDDEQTVSAETEVKVESTVE